ncbi:MAG: orotate phosphoribosyltransferase, partial [Gemmatimonadetes bacterium]|nr:orotate phosphoribosyltransferase [Gemmatimonadota bacterium]NIR76846.1 orotate phosphoribosyltransferase [Gemmatimonadota bacterium]NIT85365.1 orotate phosphoribosyltransferase [Gemmatimonadota bacterium]NIU29186.1 orotate phosphoribosyltransferase [Gemmatimonadota bacterium]NIU34283.1 orotate phosphoribosyltransferase [Gemmatimonadota bacterium]
VLVLVDREEGGAGRIEAEDLPLLSTFTAGELLEAAGGSVAAAEDG